MGDVTIYWCARFSYYVTVIIIVKHVRESYYEPALSPYVSAAANYFQPT